MRKSAGCALLLAAMLGLSVGVPPLAAAHTKLVATDPASGATPTDAPARVGAVFDEELESAFATLSVTGPDGDTWSADPAVVSDSRLSVGLRPSAPAGRYTAEYRVMSADGHVVAGSWSFSVGPH